MNISIRDSQSSYGDPRYLSTATVSDVHAPVPKTLVDGYRDALDPQHEDRSRYNPVRRIEAHVMASWGLANEIFLVCSSIRLTREAQPFSTRMTQSACTS